MTAQLGRAMAAAWPTTTPRRKQTVMDQLTTLAREAADLRPEDALIAATYMAGQWTITIHVDIPEAFAHCDDPVEETDTYGVIRVTADTLDAAVTEATRRVAAAVADTPATQIP